MSERAPVGSAEEIQRMQDGVRDWVAQAARQGRDGLRSASPAVLLSLLCASAFCPLLMATGVAGAGLSVLSGVGGGFLTQVISDVLDRLRQHGDGRPPSRQHLEQGLARQIQQALAIADERAGALRGEIAAVLQEIDAGGTALRTVMEQDNEQVRGDVIAAIAVLGSDFSEMGFLLQDVAQAAAEIQKSLDEQGADIRAIFDQNTRQSTEIRLAREDLAVIEQRTRPGARNETGAGERGQRWVHGCPYRGLQPFTEAEAEVFYGREHLVSGLAVKLAGKLDRPGLVMVTGASGAGKSSLLRAGLLPALARGVQVEGSGNWSRVVITPTRDPLTELATHLAVLGGTDTAAVRAALAHRPDQTQLTVRQAVIADAARRNQGWLSSGDAQRLVLIVDQFEQIFTLNTAAHSPAERQAFISALYTAATRPAGPGDRPPALVVIAVRGDFWDRCAAYPELASEMQEGQFVVGPMTEFDLRRAISGPADAAGLELDAALIDTILSDLRSADGGEDAAGALPLLSQAMLLTWDNRDGNRLTSRGYGQTGGVSGAVQASAESVYEALTAEQQALTREMLRRMTVASPGGRLTRRPVARVDLYAGHSEAERSQFDSALEALAAKRLVVLNDGRAEISHDALLRAWPRLRGWLEEDQASWLFHSQLTEAAAAWHASHEDPSFLYRGTQLAALHDAAAAWAANPARYPALTATQRDFLHASDRFATRGGRRRRLFAAFLFLLIIASLASAAVAVARARLADQQRNLAASGEATVVDTLLSSSTASRSSAVGPINDVFSCQNLPVAVALFEQLVSERKTEYTEAARLPTAAIPNGVTIKKDLKSALLNTLESDEAYLAWADQQQHSRCKNPTQALTFQAASNYSAEATVSKSTFVKAWNVIAVKYGFQRRSAVGI